MIAIFHEGIIFISYFGEGENSIKSWWDFGFRCGGGIDANSHNHPNKEVLDTITSVR